MAEPRGSLAGIGCERGNAEQKGRTAINIYCDTSSLFSNADRHQDAKAQQEAAAISGLLELHRQGKIRLLRSNGPMSFDVNWRGLAMPRRGMLCGATFSDSSR
jgi:hypothetical protein